MKKLLITLAAVAACGAASAQSSVNLYGVVDVSLGKTTGTQTQMYGSATPQNNARIWATACTQLSTSRPK